jgi:nitrate/nitrite transporter NarK
LRWGRRGDNAKVIAKTEECGKEPCRAARLLVKVFDLVKSSTANRPATSHYRWVICGLLFFATTFNYLDRQVISYLKDPIFCAPAAQGGFGWSNTDFANLTSFFTAFYAGMTIIAGWVIDRIGTKIGLALSLIFWSLFGIANAFVGRLVTMHILVRSAFAVGEGGNFPASIKTVAEWFPKRERALATGIFNSGSNFGAMAAALFVPWCLVYFGDERGWKMAFILTGAAGFLWLIFWFWLYEIPIKQHRLSQAEFDHIHSDKDDSVAGEKPSKGVFGKLFSISGRIPRAAFWGTMILIVILTLFICVMTSLIATPGAHLYAPGGGLKHVFDSIFKTPNDVNSIFALRMAWLIVVSWIAIALQIKRWHDLGKTGWLVLVNLVPAVGTALSLLVLGFLKGGSGANQFGNAGGPGLLGYRQTWSFFWGKFLTDGVWWFYLFWLPDYLTKQFGMTKEQVMMPTFIVFGVSIIGSVYGGSIPMTLIKKGMAVYKARMLAMFLIALAPLTVLATQYFGDVSEFGKWAATLAVATICIGAAAHQAWSANLFTTVSDMFPKKTVGSVTGIGAMAGGLGGVVVQQLAGGLTDALKENPQTAYLVMFIICALSYLLAWGIMKALVPRHQPITDL